MKELLRFGLKPYARKFPNTVKFILENYAGNLRCNRCGRMVLKEPNIEQYPYQCMHCDENMFSIELSKGKQLITPLEIEELVNCTLISLEPDDYDTVYFEKKFAAQLLTAKNILLGYELEDGELDRIDGKEVKQFLIRAAAGDKFNELWNHGKTHCSKFTIYLNSSDVFVERRPDLNNYQTKNDLMYGEEDIVVAGKAYNEFVRKSFRNTKAEYAGYLDRHKSLFFRRIKWTIDHLIEIKDLGNGNYNILYYED